MRASSRWTLIIAITTTLASGVVELVEAGEPDGKRLTIDRLYSLPHLIGTEPTGFSWSRNGRFLAFLWNDAGYNFRDVWMVDTEDAQPAPVRVTSMPQTARPTSDGYESPLELAEAEERWERDPGVTSVTWHPGGDHLLASFNGDLWQIAPGEDPIRLTDTPERETGASYSPDGGTLAFLRGGELWLRGLSGPTTRRTSVVETDVRLDDFRWAPDGSKIAVLERDEREVIKRGIPDYLAEETVLRKVARAYPGEPAVRQRLGIVDGAAGDLRWLDWGAAEPDMLLGYRWSPDGRWIALDTSDLYAKDRRIFVLDSAAGASLRPRQVVAETDLLNETFYFWRIEWSTDSQYLYFLSDRDEDYHVWAVRPEGRVEPEPLTHGPWAVAEIFPVPGGLIVVGNRGRAEERHLFRVDHDGGDLAQLSRRSGTHSPVVSPDGRWAAVHFSSQSMPPELLLTSLEPPAAVDAEKAKHAREKRVTESPVAEFYDYSWVEAEFISFPSHVDGSTLHGRIARPPDFDPTRRYPAIVGSVYTDSVRNQWGWRTAHPTWGLDQFLLQEGYVVFNVDMRGSWGRGREHRRGIRLDYGGMDIEDLESGVHYLGTLGYVDMDRIGIWGSSYGGLMTTMSLFRKPGLYAAGIAGAPATNVRHALTGQMAVMMRPQDQSAEYDDSSPVEHGHGLEDPLMIIHGMRDWVVLYKDSVTLVQRLLQLGKNVELVTLPNAGHGWDAEGLAQTRFAFRKMIDFFDRHLARPGDPGGEPGKEEH